MLMVVVFHILVPISVLVGTVLFKIRRGTPIGRALAGSLKPTAIIAIVLAALAWTGLFMWSVVATIYREHNEFVAANNTLREKIPVVEADNKQLKEQIEALKSKAESEKQAASKQSSPQQVTVPVITALPERAGVDREGFFITTLLLIPNVAIPPPVRIELEFDFPIGLLDVSPRPRQVALLGGGSLPKGTHGLIVTLPNLGIAPDSIWVVTVKSRQWVNLVSPPRVRMGY
jgi:hypothetical protein